MKKLLKAFVAMMMAISLIGCSKKEETTTKTDSEYVKDKGTLIVGVTDFAPMDYQDKDGNWIGFDADLAKAFGEKLGVKVEIVEIDWDNKVLEINSKSLDCIWNGMTLVDEVVEAMECSKAYMNNAQVVVVNKDVADKYQDATSCKELKFAVEASSAGKDMAEEYGFNYIEVKDQATTLMEVKAGTSDAAIIDALMASAMVGEGTSYENLTYTVSLNEEKYGVGFRKGSDLAEQLNAFLDEAAKDGTLDELAEKYGVSAALIK